MKHLHYRRVAGRHSRQPEQRPTRRPRRNQMDLHCRRLARQGGRLLPNRLTQHLVVLHMTTTTARSAPPPHASSAATRRAQGPLPPGRAHSTGASRRFSSRPPAQRPRRDAWRCPAAAVDRAGFARRLPPAAAREMEGIGGGAARVRGIAAESPLARVTRGGPN
jgi:hypothetical protein